MRPQEAVLLHYGRPVRHRVGLQAREGVPGVQPVRSRWVNVGQLG